LCRTAISFPGQAARDPKLGCALTTAAAYLDRIAQYIEGSARNNRAYFMRRFSRRAIARAARADTSSTTRARTRAVALGSKAIFGTRLADSRIVTVVSVALNVHVRLKSVENWCHDLWAITNTLIRPPAT